MFTNNNWPTLQINKEIRSEKEIKQIKKDINEYTNNLQQIFNQIE